jgi:hypothetical protein
MADLSLSGGKWLANIDVSDRESLISARNSFIVALRGLSESPATQLDLVSSIANDPKTAIAIFSGVLDIPFDGVYGAERDESEYVPQSDLHARALAMQGFGNISDLATKSDFASLEEGLDLAANLLYVLEKEAQNTDPLVCWSALHAINEIWFHPAWKEYKKCNYQMAVSLHMPHLLEKGVIENQLSLLENRSIARKSNIGIGLSAKYEAWLDFWVYGPANVLVNVPQSGDKYQQLVHDVLERLDYRGIEVGVLAGNRQALTTALTLAERFFSEKADLNIQKRLYDIPELRGFLINSSDIDLRSLAAEALRHISTKMDDYDNGSVKVTRVRSQVICKDWQNAAKAGNIAVPILLEVAKEKLHLSKNDDVVLSDRCKAIQTLAITSYDQTQKIIDLTQFLFDIPEIRETALKELEKIKTSLPTDVASLVTAIVVCNSLKSANLNLLTVSEMGNSVRQISDALAIIEPLAQQYKRSSNAVKELLVEWNIELSNKIKIISKNQEKIHKNQRLLLKMIESGSSIDSTFANSLNLPNSTKLLESKEYQTYDQCKLLYDAITNLKSEIIKLLNTTKTAISEKANNKGAVPLAITGGVILALTALCQFGATGLRDIRIPTPPWLGGSNSSSSSFNQIQPTATYTPQYTPQYTKGVSKSACGSPSGSQCYYPVFVKYSDRNWNSLRTDCQDIDGENAPQTQDGARGKGQIQVASFDSLQKAEGFASEMNQHYQSGWVGKGHCK